MIPDRRRALAVLNVFIALALASPREAAATWSIVAVDPETRQVGSAGASCTPFVAGIVAVAPGKGVIVAQAMSNAEARLHGVGMLAKGASPAQVIAAVANKEFDSDWQEQQYGVAALGFEDASAAFTGAGTYDVKGDLQGYGVSVQGNILTNKEVIERALAAFLAPPAKPATSRSLAERLLSALEAGAEAGGDKRCGKQTAMSSYVVVAKPDDDPVHPSTLVIVREDEGGANPVRVLRERYERARQKRQGH
ncbi:MAG TPA: DUF1028 domain-containing protein [Thermoanaerobaculia bacterium]|nr:DUF1028 domain-containing protein [Thermoanaerobaculia bacterium]